MSNTDSSDEMSGKAVIIGLGVILAGLALITVFLVFAEITFLSNLLMFLRAGLYVIAPSVMIIIGISGAVYAFGHRKPKGVLGLLSVLVAIASLAFLVLGIARNGYDSKREYLQTVSESTDNYPTFKERAAFQVASAQAAGNLGDIRGTISATRYNATNDTYSSLATRPGAFQGYAAVSVQDVELTGQATATACLFSEDASSRLGGGFNHSLDRKIKKIDFFSIIDHSDAYGYCDGDTPIVVVPLKKLEGIYPAIQVPAGVALYNGTTGEVSIERDVSDIPGPVFPISLAAEMRESTKAMGGYWDYIKNRVGYADTSHDVGNPNAANPSEFSLATKAGTASYVTPLTARGKSTSIVAVGYVDASEVKYGTLPDYTIYKLPGAGRKANSAVADRLTVDYGDLPDWASGMKIFEIAPVSNTEWVASLGKEQNVSYRVRIKDTGESCLETSEGVELRCGKVTGVNGNSPGVALAPGEGGAATGNVPLPVNPEDITKLSNDELAQIQAQLNTEILKRLAEDK